MREDSAWIQRRAAPRRCRGVALGLREGVAGPETGEFPDVRFDPGTGDGFDEFIIRWFRPGGSWSAWTAALAGDGAARTKGADNAGRARKNRRAG